MTKHVASAGRHIVREGDNCTELVFLVTPLPQYLCYISLSILPEVY